MNKISYFNSVDEMAIAAADKIVMIAAAAIKKKDRFTIALSGGNTPNRLYSLLATSAYRDKINWEKTFVFWGDERCVRADSKDNNSHNAKHALLDHIPIPKENIFSIPVQLFPAEAAKKYAETLKTFFQNRDPKFDLILLGMGDNGHTASLFPHTIVLNESKATVKEVFVEELNVWRITFTAPLINNAEHILFLVEGKEKKQMLNLVLNGAYNPFLYPAQLIQNAEWLISG